MFALKVLILSCKTFLCLSTVCKVRREGIVTSTSLIEGCHLNEYRSLMKNLNNTLQYTVPVPIKDGASIQKILLPPCTMVHFLKILSAFVLKNCTKFNKTNLFLAFFKVQLLFKGGLYWRRFGSWNKTNQIELENKEST